MELSFQKAVSPKRARPQKEKLEDSFDDELPAMDSSFERAPVPKVSNTLHVRKMSLSKSMIDPHFSGTAF